MALSAVVFKPKSSPDSEMSTISEQQPLEEEEIDEKASIRIQNRLFIGTTGMTHFSATLFVDLPNITEFRHNSASNSGELTMGAG